MILVYLSRVVSSVALTAILCCPAYATTIVIRLQKGRIVLLADSRAVDQNPAGNRVRDDACKIHRLGSQVLFAETGNDQYQRSSPTDPIPEWNASDEAIIAYDRVPEHELQKVANVWAINVTNNFQLFYRYAPQRVRSLSPPGVPFLVGIFAGRNSEGDLQVYVVRVELDDSLTSREHAAIPIGHAVDPLDPREMPYSTNGITQELIEGKTSRALAVARQWKKKSRKIPLTTSLRGIEFLIARTGDYDAQVGGPVNAAQVTNHLTTWLLNRTCKGSDK